MSQQPPSKQPTPEQQLLILRIIHGALCAGVIMATAILVSLRLANPNPPPATPLISFVGFAFAAGALLLSFVVPNIMTAGWCRQVASGKLPLPKASDPRGDFSWWPLFQVRFIVGMALLEGAALFQLIAYFIEGLPLSLGVALGLLVVMLSRFPTRTGIESWVTAQREQVEMMKQDRV